MDLKKLGFKTGKIVFPGLGLETRLEPGQYFRNDGVVESLKRHYDKLSRTFNFPAIEGSCALPDDFSDMAGFTYRLYLDKEQTDANGKAVLLAVQDRGYLENIFSLGHESVHALIRLGKEKEFTRYVNFYGFNLDPFKVFDHDEHVAHIGGLVSMHRRGRDYYYRMPVPDFVVEAFLDSRNMKVTSAYR